MQIAIVVNAAVGIEGDRTAIAGDGQAAPRRARSHARRRIDRDLRTVGVKLGTGPDDQECRGAGRHTGGDVDHLVAAEIDAAAVRDQPVGAAGQIERTDSVTRNVEPGVAANPDRDAAAVACCIKIARRLGAAIGLVDQADAAAASRQAAVDGDLAERIQPDALAGVHRDRGAIAHHDGATACDAVGHTERTQGQTGAAALDERGALRILDKGRRQPQRQRRRRIGAGRDRDAVAGELIHRHGRRDGGAIGHQHTAGPIDVIAGEAGAEERGLEGRRRCDQDRLRQGHARRDRGSRQIGGRRGLNRPGRINNHVGLNRQAVWKGLCVDRSSSQNSAAGEERRNNRAGRNDVSLSVELGVVVDPDAAHPVRNAPVGGGRQTWCQDRYDIDRSNRTKRKRGECIRLGQRQRLSRGYGQILRERQRDRCGRAGGEHASGQRCVVADQNISGRGDGERSSAIDAGSADGGAES